MAARPAITIVGPGRLGGALALALNEAGYRVAEIVARDVRDARPLARKVHAQLNSAGNATLASRVVWFSVRDEQIAAVAAEYADRDWKGKVALHASGALASDELAALRERGAAVASVHPMMSFVAGSKPELRSVTFAVEGDARAVREAKAMVGALGAKAIEIAAEKKALYHAWGAFGSPLVIALLAAADAIAEEVGFSNPQARATLAPMLRQTIENYVNRGAAAAFSGPLVRGDVATAAKHLEVLRSVEGAEEAYRALAGIALKRLPVGKRDELARLLGSTQRRTGPEKAQRKAKAAKS